MDAYKAKTMKRIGPGGFKCPCCNSSRYKQGSVPYSKDNSLNKLARMHLKIEDSKIDTSIESDIEEREYIDNVDCADEFNEYYTGFKEDRTN